MTCKLNRSAFDAIVAQAERAQPLECCGVLLGRPPDAITEAVEVRNLAEDPDRYLLDPKGHLDVRRQARQRDLEVVGFYHSHPHSSARPSSRDVAEASYPGHFYLIVGLAEVPPEIRLYRLTDGNFTETAYVTVT